MEEKIEQELAKTEMLLYRLESTKADIDENLASLKAVCNRLDALSAETSEMIDKIEGDSDEGSGRFHRAARRSSSTDGYRSRSDGARV